MSVTLQVVAVDTEVTAVTSRGLMGVKYLGAPLSAMSLAPAAGVTGFDVVVYYGVPPISLAGPKPSQGAGRYVCRVPGSRLSSVHALPKPGC